MIVNGRNQVEAQAKTLPTVAVTLGENAEDFQATNNMLDHEAFTRELAVLLFLLVRERVKFAPLVRYLAVAVQFGDA